MYRFIADEVSVKQDVTLMVIMCIQGWAICCIMEKERQPFLWKSDMRNCHCASIQRTAEEEQLFEIIKWTEDRRYISNMRLAGYDDNLRWLYEVVQGLESTVDLILVTKRRLWLLASLDPAFLSFRTSFQSSCFEYSSRNQVRECPHQYKKHQTFFL